ncbi:MAG: hypothetical protein ACFFG0_29805 [Candidatus Thorarchaeota archaeon]
MSAKSAIFSIIVSILCSVLITAGLLYFIGPVILPDLNEVSTLEEKDLVLQYKYQEWDSDAWVTDYNVVYQKINDTELSITIQENSKLYISFSSMAYLWLSYDFANYSAYSVSLVVEGVGNRTFFITHYDPRPTTGLIYQKLTYNLNIDYFTGPLSAGTYNITMYWKSLYDSTEYTYLSVADNTYDNIRSLWVMELKSF